VAGDFFCILDAQRRDPRMGVHATEIPVIERVNSRFGLDGNVPSGH
jgi:hypothetical protein